MQKTRPIAPSKLRVRLSPRQLDTREENPSPMSTGLQSRALHTLETAVHIKCSGYNVYLAGGQGTGRTHLTKEYLRPRAREMPTPPDIVYVTNFEDPDRPRCLALPAGEGSRLKKSLADAVRKIREAIPQAFEQESYMHRKENLTEKFTSTRDSLLRDMEEKANVQGFSLHTDENGDLALYPLVEGKALTAEEYESLDPETKQKFKSQSNEIMRSLLGLSRQLNQAEQGFNANEKDLERQVAEEQIDRFLQEIPDTFSQNPDIESFFLEIKKDMLENLEKFKTGAETRESSREISSLAPGPDFFVRYQVNLLVDNSNQKGAPIIIEDHPNYFNLLGCVERESELGSYYTDFSLLKGGSLHRANGGFLVLRAEDVLSSSQAWEGLIRSLRSGYARLEDPAEHYDLIKTKSLEPDPVPLQLKIILIGTDELYEFLLEADDRFRKFFKLKAHMQEEIGRTPENIQALVSALRSIAAENSDRKPTKEALCAMVDYASELVRDQKKISLRLSRLKDLIVEADAISNMEGKRTLDVLAVNSARQAQTYRLNLYEQEILEDYQREIIKVETERRKVGCVNGVAVSETGDYVLALPHQITCTVGVGHGGIADLEREAELGGPIHTKAHLILKSYLQSLFAQDKPLVLSGSISFEQSYAPVDGDSASAGELIALLSALSGFSVDLSLAITGAVSHSGAVMAVGEVSKKIEGFFEVCRYRGLKGKHGVIIPEDNTCNLMLKPAVVQAAQQGDFYIYPVQHIDQALELLTGKKAGKKLTTGGFSPGSIYQAVDHKLHEFAYLAEKKAKRKKAL